MKNKIILASASPRRIEIIKSHGINPQIFPAKITENLPSNISMKDAVMFLALKKALWVESQVITNDHTSKGSIIIGADTVVFKNEIMGKPTNRSDAFNMLSKIKNTDHYVATGVAVVVTGENNKVCFCETTKVFCKDITNRQLNAYLDTDEPYDKAGAYAIQGLFSKYIDHYDGEYDNVVGLPWNSLEKVLKNLHVL